MTNYFENCFTLDDIHEAYKSLVRKYHPDFYGFGGNKIMVEVQNQFSNAITRFCKDKLKSGEQIL